MLENVETHELQREVFRYAVTEESDKHFAATLGLNDQDLEEIASPDKQTSIAPEKQFRSRFTNGEFEVFYTAFELQTAEAEIRHHSPAWAAGNTKPTPYHYSGSRMVFTGLAKDLRPLASAWPKLIYTSDYSFCNSLGVEAVELKLDALVVPSVRQLGGTNLPIFRRASAVVLSAEGELILTYPEELP